MAKSLYRFLRACAPVGVVFVLVAAGSSCRPGDGTTPEASTEGAIDVDVSIDYTDAEVDCGHLGYRDFSYHASEDRTRAAVDLDRDGSTDAFRTAAASYFRASAFGLEAPTTWVVIDGNSDASVRDLAAGTTLDLWSYGILKDQIFDPFAETSRTDSIETTVQTDEGEIEVSVEASGNDEPVDTPHVAPAASTAFENLPLIDVLSTRADMRPACSAVVFAVFDASRRACVANVVGDHTVEEWARDRSTLSTGC